MPNFLEKKKSYFHAFIQEDYKFLLERIRKKDEEKNIPQRNCTVSSFFSFFKTSTQSVVVETKSNCSGRSCFGSASGYRNH